MENLLRPWILALLLASGAAALAWARGLFVAIAVIRGFSRDARDEAQIQLERSAELGARFIFFGALASAAAFGLLVFGADHAAREIRGAMCAYGVLDSTSVGFLSAALGLAVFASGVVWSQAHRLDLELREPRLTEPKFIAFVALAPLALASAIVNVLFVTELDFSIIATCCSASTDFGDAGDGAVAVRGGPRIHLPLHLAALGAAAVASIANAKRPTRTLTATAGALTVFGVLFAVPALIHHVAPHIYETPNHRCPFCLLHFPEAWLGIPLYGAMTLSFFAGTGLLVRAADPRWREGGDEPRRSARRRALGTALALLALATLMVAPLLRYHLATGGASLFGAGP